MAARLGHEGAEVEHHLESDWVLLVDPRITSSLTQRRVQVRAVALEPREPGIVVDARAIPGHLLVRDVEVAGELSGRSLHAVAQADDGEVRASQRGKGQDRHRVRVVEDDRLRRDALDVADDVEPRRAGAQGLEDSSWADGVADALVDAVAQRDVVVEAHVPEPGDLDRVYDVVGPFENVQTVGRGFAPPALSLQLDQTLGDAPGQLEAGGVDVDEGEYAFVQAFDGED